ncbi:MAG TPA: hypothetical protein VK699_01635 [Terriglobales bacterium]|jgi:hypothetical protein|nr:hypothetical protein [Terriglobales bacterium]
MKQSDKPHPGINYHKFSVGGDWEGVFIVIACSALLFAIHTPFTGLFLIFSVLLGIVIGLFLRLARRDKLVNTHTFLPLEPWQPLHSVEQNLNSLKGANV